MRGVFIFTPQSFMNMMKHIHTHICTYTHTNTKWVYEVKKKKKIKIFHKQDKEMIIKEKIFSHFHANKNRAKMMDQQNKKRAASHNNVHSVFYICF